MANHDAFPGQATVSSAANQAGGFGYGVAMEGIAFQNAIWNQHYGASPQGFVEFLIRYIAEGKEGTRAERQRWAMYQIQSYFSGSRVTPEVSALISSVASPAPTIGSSAAPATTGSTSPMTSAATLSNTPPLGAAPIGSPTPAIGSNAASTGSKTYGLMADGRTVMWLGSDDIWHTVYDEATRQRVIAYAQSKPGTYDIPDDWIPEETTPTGGGNMPGNIPGGALGPYTDYLQKIGLGQGYWNPAQRYLAGMYQPMRNLWEQGTQYRTALGQPTSLWEDYMTQIGAGGNNMINNVQGGWTNILQSILGLSPGEREERGLTFEPQWNEAGQATYPTGQMSQEDLQYLLQQGTKQRFNPIGANYLAQSAPRMQQQWQLQQAANPTGQTFLDYLRSKYGI